MSHGIGQRPLDAAIRPTSLWASALVMTVAALTGCSADGYKEDTDEEAYEVIGQFQEDVYGGRREFSIDPPQDTFRDALLEDLRAPRESGDASGFELNLEYALAVAAENSREFQREKESVYLAALDFILERHRFENNYFGTVSGNYDRLGGGDGGTTSRTRSGDASTGFTRSLAQGGRLVLTFASDLVRRLTGIGSGDGTDSSSLLTLQLTQPLLRDAGRQIAQEPLTQSERNLVYALRDFERFRLTFSTQIAREFYNVLLQGAFIINEELNRANVEESFNRTKALADEGRLPLFQVDQAQQNLLSADNRLINTRDNFSTALDRFKLTLGLPTDATLLPDENVLQSLRDGEEPQALALEESLALELALENRRDLMNAQDRFDDAERRVVVARDALKAGLDFSATARFGTEEDKPLSFDLDESDYLLGLSLDLPFERVAEANAYRASLISLEQSKRNLQQTEDNVKFDIRQGLRDVAQTQETYDIQKNSVALAEARVSSTELLLERGRVDTRDLLEAQEALVQARNTLVGALVDYRIARLELLRDLGLLEISETELLYRDNLEEFEMNDLENQAEASPSSD